MAGFQIGDILANLGLDLTQLRKDAAAVKATVQKISSDIRGAFTFRTLGAGFGAFNQGLFATRRNILALGEESTRTSRVIQGVFRGLGAAVRAPITAFRSLLSSVLSIRGALATFGVVKLFERAGEVDNLTGAFRSLSRSIGALSDNFLARLRRATRGTISDLELMRLTNNAILLDVARNADQFVQLAEAARRLGQATGRTTTQAMEDLNLGIGRQSRLLLDNLGIIVKVQKAYEKYAVSIGKTATQLTQSEQRFAFQQEVFRAIEERVATLGPDLETVGQAVQRLGATLQNVFSDVARSIISRESVVGIADLLDRNRPKIAAFVSFVRERVGQIVQAIITGFNRLRSGELNIADALNATIGVAFRAVARFISAAITNLVPVFLKAGVLLGEQLVQGLLNGIRQRQIALRSDIRSFLSRIVDVPPDQQLARRAQEALDTTFRAFVKLQDQKILPKQDLDQIANQLTQFGIVVSDALGGSRKITEQFLSDIQALQAGVENALTAPSLLEKQKEFSRAVDAALSAQADTLRTVTAQTGEDVRESLGILTGDLEGARRTMDEVAARFRLRAIDPLAGIQPLQTDRFVQPLADVVNKVIALRERVLLNTEGLARALGNLPIPGLDKFVDKVRQGFEPLAIQLSALPTQGLINFVDVVNTQVTRLKRLFRPRELEPEAFGKIINDLENRLRELNFASLEIGATAGTRAVLELQKAFDGMFDQLSDAQLVQLDRLGVQLRAAASANEAAEAIANLREELEGVGRTQADRAIRRIMRDIGAFRLSDEFNLDGDAIQREFDKINILAPFEQQAPRVKEQLDAIGAAVRTAFDAGDTDGIRRSIENITGVATRLEAVKFDPLTQRQAQVILDHIATIGEKLRGALNAREAVEDLTRRIKEIRDLSITIEVNTDIRDLRDQVEAFERDVRRAGLRPGEVLARDIDRQIREIEALRAQGKIDSIQQEIATRDLINLREQALAAQGRAEFQDLTKGVSDSVFGGILDGFERGESASKIWADVVSNIFRKSMGKVIDQLTTQISSAFGSLFQQAGLGVGAADFATGLIGIGSSILVGLRNRRDQTVNDFAQQVNSSEAIRGVVAGPTNVAIAKVGDSLKVALRQTEILLERIAVSVERGGGGGGGGGSGGSFGLRLTSSTPT